MRHQLRDRGRAFRIRVHSGAPATALGAVAFQDIADQVEQLGGSVGDSHGAGWRRRILEPTDVEDQRRPLCQMERLGEADTFVRSISSRDVR